jgi:hypothetical protein
LRVRSSHTNLWGGVQIRKIGSVTQNPLTLMYDHLLRGNMEPRLNVGLFVTFSSEELEEFERWRTANSKQGGVIVIEAVSRRRPDKCKVWFAKPLPNEAKLPWYKPIEEVFAARPTEQTQS